MELTAEFQGDFQSILIRIFNQLSGRYWFKLDREKMVIETTNFPEFAGREGFAASFL